MKLPNDQLSFALQIVFFVLAFAMGVLLPRCSVWVIGFLCGFVGSAIIAYIVVGGGGPGGLPALVIFPILCAGLARVGQALRGA